MKTVYKFLMLGAFALTATTSFAQTPTPDPVQAKTDLYTKFTTCWTKDLKPTEKAGTGGDKAAIDACVAVAKEYVDKYGSDNDQYSKFVQAKYTLNTDGRNKAGVATRFDKALNVTDTKTINADEAFASGKDFIAANPDSIDAMLALVSVGFDQVTAQTPVDKYNADTINYAKMVIDKINAGKTSTLKDKNGRDQYGVYKYVYTSDKYPDGKNNALGFMNYYIGYIMYNRMNQKKEALPYLYKASQANSATKENPDVYRLIGSWYQDEFVRLDNDRTAKIKAANNQDTDETKSIYAMEKGYAERAADAYVRAYTLANKDTAATKEYKDALLARAKQFYGIRFNNDPAKFDGYDAYATAVATKPFVDPATAVTPVVEETPATTTTTPTTGTTPTTPATTTTPAPTTTPATKPATTTTPTPTTTKPPTTTTTTTNKTTTTTTKKP